MSEHSGYTQPKTMAEGQPGEPSGIPIEDAEYDKLTELWNTESNHLRQIAELALELDSQKERTREARKARDLYCKSLEEKYEIQKGARWDLNTDDKSIVVHKAQQIIKHG